MPDTTKRLLLVLLGTVCFGIAFLLIALHPSLVFVGATTDEWWLTSGLELSPKRP